MKYIRFFIFVLITIALIGCGRGSEPNPEPKLELYVLSTTPTDQSNNVERNVLISVEFNSNVDSSTVNDSTFIVKDQHNNLVVSDEITLHENIINFKPKLNYYPLNQYIVTITNELKNLTGTFMQNDYSFSFITRNSTWSTPDQFIQSAGYSKTAMDNQGNVIIVNWNYNYSNGHYEIIKEEMRDNTWNEPKIISEIAGQAYRPAYNPSVAMDNNGNAIIAWEQWTDDSIVMTEYRNGNWSEPLIFDAHSDVSSAALAMNDAGNAIIVWERNNNIYKSEYYNETWSSPESISDDNYARSPQVAIDNNGNGVIVWFHFTGMATENKLFSSELVNGTWNSPKVISVDGKDPDSFDLAMDDNGKAIVVWGQINTEYQIYKNEFGNGSWIGPEAVSQDGIPTYAPHLAISSNGNAIIVWQQSNNNTWQIYRNEYVNGIWDIPSPISPSGIDVRMPYVDMDVHGNAILVWNQKDGSNWQVIMKHLFDGEWSDNTLFATSDNTLNPVMYDIAMNYSGDAIIVWEQSINAIWYQFKSQYQ